MREVLPREELPAFFSSLERMGTNPRKSLRIRRDLLPADSAKWTVEKFRDVGIPIEETVAWYDRGFFFDLAKMKPHPSRHAALGAGLVFLQEAGAMEVVPALGVHADHLVLDLCAAPGAKSSHIGEYLGPGTGMAGGWLVANEPVRDRAKLLDAILARHGIGNSTVFNSEPYRLARAFPEVFDRVLVDAPCSGESLFAKRAEKRKDVSHKEVDRCALRQRAILEHGWRMLSPGGRLVYSTCAYSRAENEDLVATFVADHPDAKLTREARRFPHRDAVPGGFFAVLAKPGDEEGTREERRRRLREGIRGLGTRGLVRDGRLRWDGTPDAYAILMDRKSVDPVPDRERLEVTLDLETAARFLGGERSAPPAAEKFAYVWEGEAIAGGSGGTLHYPRGKF